MATSRECFAPWMNWTRRGLTFPSMFARGEVKYRLKFLALKDEALPAILSPPSNSPLPSGGARTSGRFPGQSGSAPDSDDQPLSHQGSQQLPFPLVHGF